MYFLTTYTASALLGVLTVLLYGYKCLLKRLRKLAWMSMISKNLKNRPPVIHGVFHRLSDIKSGAASSSGGVTAHEGLYMVLNQWPVYFFYLLRFMTIVLPSRVPPMVFSYLKHGTYGTTKSEKDIIDMILSIPALYMMCKPVERADPVIQNCCGDYYPTIEDDHIWLWEIPREFSAVPFEGNAVLKDLSIIFLEKERRVIRAIHQGRDIDPASSSNLLFSIVVGILGYWSHFKSHLMAEISAEEIINKGIEKLEPSARFVHSLHSGLLNSATSPAVPGSLLYSIATTRESFEESMGCPMPHYIVPAKRNFAAFAFFLAARKSIAANIKAHDLKVSVEPLFQNMIVHCIDHHLGYEYLILHDFSLDGSESFMSYMRSLILIEFWMFPKINPFDDVRLCAVARNCGSSSFYSDVYRDLKRADPILADRIIASTCF